MTNLEKYEQAFCDSLEVTKDQLVGLEYQQIPSWDSVGHMGLVAAIEDAFDIMMDTDDIIDLSSFEKGKEILAANYGIEF
ncbi:MAG: acyl carrier protein [Acetatifactor sp.]